MATELKTDPEIVELIPPLLPEEYAQLEANLVKEGCLDTVKYWCPDKKTRVRLDGHNRQEICTRLGLPYEVEEVKTIADQLGAKIWVANNQLGRRNLPDFAKFELVKKIGEFEKERQEGLERKKAGGRAGGQTAGRGRPKELGEEDDRVSPNVGYAYSDGARPTDAPPDALTDEPASSGNPKPKPVKKKGARAKADPVAEKAAEEKRKEKNRKKAEGKAAAALATRVGMSRSQVEKLKYIDEHANAEMKKLLRTKKLTVAAAYTQLRNEELKRQQAEKRAKFASGERPLPTGKFEVILADPAWHYEHAISTSREIENQYPTMDIDKICALPVEGIASDDAVLYLWVPSPKIEDGVRVAHAWGFSVRASMVWVKDKIGMGYWARQRHELLYVCVRGDFAPPPAPVRPDSVIMAPRGTKHSKKPDRVYELLEELYPEFSKVELFCRKPRKGWATWGNEV